MNDELRLSVQRIAKLPTLPAIAGEVLNLADDNMLSVDKLESIIENDPPMASKILSVSNSAFFGTETHHATIRSAIMRIGFNNVRNIALGIALLTFLGGNCNYPVPPRRIFKHSVAAGLIAKLLATRLGLHDPDEMFLCGMLHDLGIFVLNCHAADIYQTVIREAGNERTLTDAERKMLGFTHSEVGVWLADKWHLPDVVTASIRFHHEPSLTKEHRIAIIHLADYISSKSFFSVTEQQKSYLPDDSVFGTLNISRTDLAKMETEVDGQMISEWIFAHE